MGSHYEVEIKIVSARNLKNVNWRHGSVRPYAVVWVDPNAKCSTRVDDQGDTDPSWDETLVVPVSSPIEDSTLSIDIVHANANAEEDTKPLIGSARLPLRDVVDEAGLGSRVDRELELSRPSGRPHGKLEVRVNVREQRYRAPDPHYAPPYGVQPPTSRDYQPAPYGNTYGAPPPGAYADPPTGYPSAAPQPAYGQPSYGQPAYGQPSVEEEEKKKSKFGMGTGLAVGVAAGALGALALSAGAEHVENKIADDAAEKVEHDLDYDESGDEW